MTSKFFLDWLSTHKLNPDSKYFNGSYETALDCTYYIVFEQNYSEYQWWEDKKKRLTGPKSGEQIELDRKLVEAVGCPSPFGTGDARKRKPDPELVKELLEQGAQPDFVVPRLPYNKRQR